MGGVASVSNAQTSRQLRVAYNSVFCRIFNYGPWQSVKEFQGFLLRPTWKELVEKHTKMFFDNLQNHTFLNALFPRTMYM